MPGIEVQPLAEILDGVKDIAYKLHLWVFGGQAGGETPQMSGRTDNRRLL
jgi:hypothetical protein